jgi:uncharacterized protein (DUF111 family)
LIVYLDSSRGISAGLVLGALLDAGADAALVQRILGTVTLPRIALMQARDATDVARGTAASVAVGPVPRGTRLFEVIQTLERGRAPLAVRTWGGGMLARLLEAEAMARGIALDMVPLTDVVTVAELLAVSAALAALRIVRVYAAPLVRSREAGESGSREVDETHRAALALSTSLLAEAEWPEPDDGPLAAVTPSGAAMLAALAEPGVPAMRLAAVGYGIGQDAPHLLRCTVGEPYPVGVMPRRDGSATHTHDYQADDGDNH